MRVLITGGSGFLGRQIVAECHGAGHEVLAPRSHELDLTSALSVDDYFRAQATHGVIDAVIHSAAIYGGIGFNTHNQLDLTLLNTSMAVNIFDATARYKVKKFVSVGSTCSYPGDMPDTDMDECQIFNGRCHPSVEPYGYVKRLHLVMGASAHEQHGISFTQVSLTNLYGEYDVFQEHRSHVLSALIKKVVDAKQDGGDVNAWGTGAPIRQFLYVKDAAYVIQKALYFPHDEWPVNVGGDALTIRELAYLISDTVGLPRERIVWDAAKPDGVARKVVKQAKLRRLLPDYMPTALKDGLPKTISWYLENQTDAVLRQ